jgi:hypothetical protein
VGPSCAGPGATVSRPADKACAFPRRQNSAARAGQTPGLRRGFGCGHVQAEIVHRKMMALSLISAQILRKIRQRRNLDSFLDQRLASSLEAFPMMPRASASPWWILRASSGSARRHPRSSAHRLNHFPELAHHLAFLRIHRQRPCGPCRETADRRRHQRLADGMRTTDRTFNQAPFALPSNPCSRKTMPRTRDPCRNAD